MDKTKLKTEVEIILKIEGWEIVMFGFVRIRSSQDLKTGHFKYLKQRFLFHSELGIKN